MQAAPEAFLLDKTRKGKVVRLKETVDLGIKDIFMAFYRRCQAIVTKEDLDDKAIETALRL